MTVLRHSPNLAVRKGKLQKGLQLCLNRVSEIEEFLGCQTKVFSPFVYLFAYDSIYPILAPGLLFFLPHREARSLVGAYVGAAFVLSASRNFRL
jgi:hypothetical protein